MKTVKDRVMHLLEQYPDTRNSDSELVLQYWAKFERGLIFEDANCYIIPKSTAKSLTNPETVIRWRAYIQNEMGLYKPTEQKVIEKRQSKEAEYKTFFSRSKQRGWQIKRMGVKVWG